MESINTRMLAAVTMIIFFALSTELGSCKVVQFIFGDSLSDVGNNNYLSKSLARANLPWYGIDFGNGMPNGRFSNGRTVADIIGDKMGLPRPPAFLDPSLTEDMILENGVNYASGGGGILNETGGMFIQRLSLYKQIDLFQGTQELIRKKIGPDAAQKFFAESNYVVALGSNDFINNYLLPIYRDSWTYTDSSFVKYLMETLEKQLTLLYNLGGRQMTVFGLGPMGCIPLQRVLSVSDGCQEKTNNLALNFNRAGQKLVTGLSKKLQNSSIKFGDAYDVVADVIKNPRKYGFNNSDSPCCSFGDTIRPALTCIPASLLCEDRSKYVFWDEYHPSDRANEIIANEIYRKLGFLYNNNGTSSPSPATAPAAADGPSSNSNGTTSPSPAMAPSAADGPSSEE